MKEDTKELQHLVEVLSGLVRRAQRAFRFSGRDMELSPLQVIVLAHLEQTPRRVGALAAASGVAQNTMSEVVGRMQRQGLVKKVRDEHDQRVVLVETTEKGKRALARQREHLNQMHARLLRLLTPEQRHQLVQSVSNLVELMEYASSRNEENDP